MAIRFDKTTQMLEKSLDLRMSRQQLLTSNLANIDTPHYKPRDLEFEGFLKEASGITVGGPQAASATDNVVGDETFVADSSADEVITRERDKDTLDGNRVELDETVARITDNSMRYNAALELMRRKIAVLSYAANGGQG